MNTFMHIRSKLAAFFTSKGKANGLIASVVTVALGVSAYLLLHGAALGFFSGVEGETGVVAGNAMVVTDATASGGKAVRFGAAAPTPTPTPTPVPGTPYVQPGTQGYQGLLSALTVYSAANGKIPPGVACSWNQAGKYLDCSDTNLTLDHVYIQGGIYWRGCGNLTITNSIEDWQPSTLWFNIQSACQAPNAGATITVQHSTLETGPSTGSSPSAVPIYTGGSDVAPINEYTGEMPQMISNSLLRGFPQGVLTFGSDSMILNNEIYTQDAQCSGGVCHGDGIFNEGADNATYQGNYVVTPISNPSTATSVLFWQSSPNSTGTKVIGNFLKGGSYTLYNENGTGVDVENNTLGGYTFGDCSLSAGASWSIWSGNIKPDGTAVAPSGNGCN